MSRTKIASQPSASLSAKVTQPQNPHALKSEITDLPVEIIGHVTGMATEAGIDLHALADTSRAFRHEVLTGAWRQIKKNLLPADSKPLPYAAWTGLQQAHALLQSVAKASSPQSSIESLDSVEVTPQREFNQDAQVEKTVLPSLRQVDELMSSLATSSTSDILNPTPQQLKALSDLGAPIQNLGPAALRRSLRVFFNRENALSHQDAERVVDDIVDAYTQGKESLDLSSRGMTSLPGDLALLTNLKFFDMSGNDFRALPQSVFTLRNLCELKAQNCGLSHVDATIGKLTRLRVLDLCHNEIASLPAEVKCLTHLTELRLSHNRLTAIPEVVSGLPELQKIAMSSNQIGQVPENIGELKKIVSLSLENNCLIALPPSLWTLSRLSHLDVSKNKIRTIHDSLRTMTALNELNLNHNQLETMPAGVVDAPHLTILRMQNCHLTSLSSNIGDMSHLCILDVGLNALTSLPDSFAKLHNLNQLQLHSNRFEEIPDVTQHLAQLRSLNITFNPLQSKVPAPKPTLMQRYFTLVLNMFGAR